MIQDIMIKYKDRNCCFILNKTEFVYCLVTKKWSTIKNPITYLEIEYVFSSISEENINTILFNFDLFI